MANIKSLDRISAKWVRVAGVSQEEYKQGVENPRADWATQTAIAETNYELGVQKAIQSKRFGAGVKKAGTAKWKEHTLAKGPARWSEGIGLSANAYEEGFSPYANVIKNLNLPPRGPKGDPKNIQRVAAVANALHQEKIKRTSA
jgi:hypothetical protein